MPDDNPYAAPTASIAPPAAVGAGTGWRWHFAWAVVFGVNLIVPLIFGSGVARGAAWLGVALAIPLMLILGHLLCARSRHLRVILVTGGVCVGLSQVMPMLQFLAGMTSFMVTIRLLGLPPDDDTRGPEILTAPGGFLMTVLTGGQLMIAALVCGKVVLTIKGAWDRRRR
ncbi:MAG: hypothetical protein LC745_12600 [Planctomycetia bacterium]|nr:hypothetical protein [Planctomycetia bacterium]